MMEYLFALPDALLVLHVLAFAGVSVAGVSTLDEKFGDADAR